MSKNKDNTLAQVFHFDLYGKRDDKYEFLNNNSLKSIAWNSLEPTAPNYFLVKKDFDESGVYEKGFKVDELFFQNSSGIETRKDNLTISHDINFLEDVINDFKKKSVDELAKKYRIDNKSRDWKIEWAKDDINANLPIIKEIAYKPFEKRFIIYTGKTKGINGYPMYNNFKHIILGNNIGLCLMRKLINTNEYKSVFVSNTLMDKNFYGFQTYLFPLYLYPSPNAQQTIGQTAERTPNLSKEIVKQIAEKLGLTFTNEKTSPTPPKEGLSQYADRVGSGIDASPTPPKEGLSQYADRVGSGIDASLILAKERLSHYGYMTANPINYNLIKEMRDTLKANPTASEKVMWEYLRNKKIGYKIRRQHIIDDFITDFVCLIKKVVIEIDGKIHLKQKQYDELRTARLNELGYEVIRFTNEEVFANPEMVANKIKEKLDNKLDFSPPSEGLGEVFAPIDILDYIYAVLHSPTYREKYKEFLKIDFPRVPYPKDAATFWQLVALGGAIRQIHLLESPIVEKYITQYPEDGNNTVGKIKYLDGKVYINETQYFDSVPEVAWNFYIGGYQPAQKWLKDRKERVLDFDDILHYQKIIVALSETDRLMKEVDKIDIE